MKSERSQPAGCSRGSVSPGYPGRVLTGCRQRSDGLVYPSRVSWADAAETPVDPIVVDITTRGMPHQRSTLDIAAVHCDKVDIDIPKEFLPDDEDRLPHDTAATGWSVSKVLPPELVDDKEVTDELVEAGLRIGSAGNGREKLKAMLCEYTPI